MRWQDFYRENTGRTGKELEVGINDWKQRSGAILKWISYIPRNSKILDCGCGIGVLGLILVENGYNDVIGIDINAGDIKKAGQNYKKSYHMNCDKINIKENNFDMIIALNLIEHLENPELFLENVRKMLAPAGIIILSLPNEIWFRKILNRIPKNHEHKHHWSYLQFCKFIEKQGFEVLDIKPVGRIPFIFGCQTFMVKIKVRNK